MDEVMFGNELHPDRVIPIEKLYEILNEYGINYSFPAQHGIESSAFAVVRCKDCKHYKSYGKGLDGFESFGNCQYINMDIDMPVNGYCCFGERKTDGKE